MRQLAARLPPSEPTQSPVPVSPPPVAHVNRQTASPGTGHHSIPTQPPKTAHQPPLRWPSSACQPIRTTPSPPAYQHLESQSTVHFTLVQYKLLQEGCMKLSFLSACCVLMD